MNKTKEHTYDWKKVIIGGSLDALIQAYKTNSHIIINNVDPLFPFDPISDNEYMVVDHPEISTKYDLWNYISYKLGERGLNPHGLGVTSVKFHEDHITVLTSSNHKTIIRAKDIVIYGMQNVSGLDRQEDEVESFRVFDWFNVRKGMNHDLEEYMRKEQFCNKFYFYLSERIDGNKKYKDLVVESSLTKKQIQDPDYSDAIARLIATRTMKEVGIHKQPVLETSKRELIPVRKKIYYEFSFSGNHTS